MRIHLLALEWKCVCERVRSVRGGRRMFSHDAVLFHHMASKWKRWASCLFSRSSAFWTHTQKKCTVKFFVFDVRVCNIILQHVLQLWIHGTLMSGLYNTTVLLFCYSSFCLFENELHHQSCCLQGVTDRLPQHVLAVTVCQSFHMPPHAHMAASETLKHFVDTQHHLS